MARFPFTAVVGADDLGLALLLCAIDPHIGGVLVRGEKGTAKSTIVRGLVDVLPEIEVVDGCRFSCSPTHPDPGCPDGPHPDASPRTRPTRLVELPVGATDDRVTGSLDLASALGKGRAEFHPGLLAAAHRGILYVDEVNLLHDHLVDVLLDAAAMGRNTVERDGMSVQHAAQIVLVGTMNPEEGELRPQLLDRFGLSVDVVASRDPEIRAEVVTRRLAHDADPDAFARRFDAAQRELREHIVQAHHRLRDVQLTPRALRTIARVCAGFDVDGMRADIVVARTAVAHAAWRNDTEVTKDDIRIAARFALAHRRRRGPFDPPGLDEDLLEQLLDEDDPEPDPPEPDPSPDDPSPDDQPPEDSSPDQNPPGSDGSDATESTPSTPPPTGETDAAPNDADTPSTPPGAAPTGTARAGSTYAVRRFEVSGLGDGASGKRSRAYTTRGRVVGIAHDGSPERPVHLPATLTAAARRSLGHDGFDIIPGDVRRARTQGRESNLVLFCVDASGSMAARKRMHAVKTAVLSLLVDAYERRDKVGLVTFRADRADVVLQPTSSVDLAAAALQDLPHGGRTPLAEGLTTAVTTLTSEKRRDPRRRALVVLVTDGRATSGEKALDRAREIADRWHQVDVETVVVDCESGRFRMGLAADLATRMHATHVPLADVSAHGLLEAINQEVA